MKTDPQSILVTGASRGIGLLTSQSLAAAGHRVYATMRDPQGRNREAARRLLQQAAPSPGQIHVVDLDVTLDRSVDAAVRHIETIGPVDVLVNNAGVMPVGVTEAFTVEQFRRCLDVNVLGVARTTRALLPQMRARGSGLLIHMSSTAGRVALPFFGMYCASKWALEAYAESLHYELESFGIESILVEPGGHGTDLVHDAPAPADGERQHAYGDLADGRDKLLGMFKAMFEAGEDITDAQNVADAVLRLIEASAPRPLRTTVGNDMGLAQINERTAPIQAGLIQSLRPAYTA